MPVRMPSKVRLIPAKLIEQAKLIEFDKLYEYYLTPVLPARAPPHSLLRPHLRRLQEDQRIHRLQSDHISSLFTDTDLRGSFHQIPVAEYSSQRLAIQTVWGTFRPRFVPEGTSPASFYLQKIVPSIFVDSSDWMTVIFDDLLILGDTYEEIYDKTTEVIERCYQRNVKLKMSKCWLGVKKVSFFGYEIENNCYGLGQQRRGIIAKIPMP
jgi:hypothetical protein